MNINCDRDLEIFALFLINNKNEEAKIKHEEQTVRCSAKIKCWCNLCIFCSHQHHSHIKGFFIILLY